ncbi:MAG: diguanylate cyclase [Phycisphaerae bacterium]|nr:diguanylate cyclase [Phycisphaerae bacterium]
MSEPARPILSDASPNQARIITICCSDSVKDAAAKMLSHNVGCLIVNDDQGHFVGLVTERDIARHVAVRADSGAQILVSQIMTAQVVSCSPGITTSEARRIMMDNRIRHLPLINSGKVVGILSARDIISQQLVEDRTAAEEVAMLSKCLKSIDLNEAAEIVAAEAPKLFEARNSVLCLYPAGDRSREPELISSNRCPCVGGHLMGPQDVETRESSPTYCHAEIPLECSKCGGKAPRMVLPLDIVGLPEAATGKEKRLSGYLCMCGLPESSLSNEELTQYKAGLTREILVAHLTNATRYQQARLTSLTDALTGVGSRKLLEEKLLEECDRAKRYKRSFSVAILDLDHFKMINDALGHVTGDDAIRKLAECVKREKRGPDVLTRYGGDEFVLLLPETKAAEATVLLERVRARVREIRFDQGMGLSISCGIAECILEADESPDDVMRRADVALYEAKNAGRNCVKLWNEEMARLLNASDIEIERVKRLQRRIMGLSEKAEKVFMESIWSLVQALEAKDAYARKHSENVTAYSVEIARTMELGPKYVDLIQRSAMIHDIGKIGVPDAVLFKPDHLTGHERWLVEQHPLVAVRILERMSFLETETSIVRHHHEKWNGQGYPDGLARTAIPLGARIIAVADTFDALTSNRAYHTSRPIGETLAMLKDSAGYEFDPTVVIAMVTWIESAAKQLGVAIADLAVDDLLSTCESLRHEREPAMASVGADEQGQKILESIVREA